MLKSARIVNAKFAHPKKLHWDGGIILAANWPLLLNLFFNFGFLQHRIFLSRLVAICVAAAGGSALALDANPDRVGGARQGRDRLLLGKRL